MKKVISICAAMLLFAYVNAQEVSIPEIGVEAPSFTAQSTMGTVKFPSDYGRNWKILLSHPKDFTPVCSSEILEFASQQKSFDDLNTEIVFVSSDNLDQHESWIKALEEVRYKGKDPVKINFPILVDEAHTISKRYGMIHSATSVTQNIRGVYILDPDNVIRSMQFYPNEVGRDVNEIKRTLLALQATYNNDNVVAPANWEPGDDMIVPVLTQEERNKIGTPGSDYYQLTWFMVYKKSN